MQNIDQNLLKTVKVTQKQEFVDILTQNGLKLYKNTEIFSFYKQKVEQWASDRNLIEGSTPERQFHKLIQECGEWSDDYCKGKDSRGEFGDILVVLIIIAKQLDINIEECLSIAYEKIKDRKGRMVNGVFVKEEDL